MERKHASVLTKFRDANWVVRMRQPSLEFPPELKKRYSWIPPEVEKFIMEIELLSSPDEKTFFLGGNDFLGCSASAYKWNEWETLSRNAAGGDAGWIASITQFWDEHFPIVYSVKSGYAYFAIRKSDLSVVCGEEPEFEETTRVAASFWEFLILLPRSDDRLNRWV